MSYQDNAYWYTSINSSLTETAGPGKLSDIPANAFTGDLHASLPAGDSQVLEFLKARQ